MPIIGNECVSDWRNYDPKIIGRQGGIKVAVHVGMDTGTLLVHCIHKNPSLGYAIKECLTSLHIIDLLSYGRG